MKNAIVFTVLLIAESAMPQSPVCSTSDSGTKLVYDCTKYIVCAHGLTTEMNCPPPLYFTGAYCDYPANVPQCSRGVRELPNEQKNPSIEPAPVNEEPIFEEEPAPVNEEPTFEEEPAPVNEEPSFEEEPTPTEQIMECPFVPYYYIANPTNTNAFFICQKGIPKGPGKCGQGLVFNQAKQYCH